MKSIQDSKTALRILLFIHEYKQKHPYSPDLREITRMLAISSTSVVGYHLDKLEKAGLIGFLYVNRNKAARTVHVTKRGKVFIKDLGDFSVKIHDDVADIAT